VDCLWPEGRSKEKGVDLVSIGAIRNEKSLYPLSQNQPRFFPPFSLILLPTHNFIIPFPHP